MSRLTIIKGLPKPAPRVAPHNYRSLGGRVLLTTETGGYAVLTEKNYRDYLSGGALSAALESELRGQGLLSADFDFDASARFSAGTDFFAWPGPWRHVLVLERAGRRMDLDAARAAVDFAFSAPGPTLRLEIVCASQGQEWPVLWFLVQYARRMSEWRGRPVKIVVRLASGGWPGERLDFLRGHGVVLGAAVTIDGPPAAKPPAGVHKITATVIRVASPEAWVAAFSHAGADTVRLEPSPALRERGLRRFLGFYAAFLDGLLGLEGLREERAAAFLSRTRWMLPGLDVLSELAYGPDGEIHTSEAGMKAEGGLFRLGKAGTARYEDLPRSDAVRASLMAVHPDNQPLCFHCVYNPYCALPPSENLLTQGTVWGRTPSSSLCSLHMGILDILFERLLDPKVAARLRRWSGAEL